MSGLSRREMLLGGAAMALPAFSQADEKARSILLPGPYRGKVVEVKRADSVENGKINRDAVRAMMERGMRELTGAKDEAEAWKRFFKPGDIVGIKPCLVGLPKAISQHETFLEVIRGLNLAGVPNKNIVIINRYKEELDNWKFEPPAGVTMNSSAPAYDDFQVDTKGYDTRCFVEFPRVMTGMDDKNPVHRRSHLCDIIPKLDKIVNVCCLKDHGSAGITMALKNMSHGFVNNVCRTHIAPENWCDVFIPTVVAMPQIRKRAVLHIGDALIAGYNGGPGGYGKNFRSWEHKALFFATDPTAMDRVGWRILDEKRVENGLPKLAESGIKLKDYGAEAFDFRQPEHILIAGRMGLGESDLKKIKHQVIELRA